MNSYTQHIKNEMLSNREKVMKLLNWSQEQYSNFQFKCGTQYLQCYIPKDPHGIDQLVSNRLFWNWWKNQWLSRDQDFLKDSNVKLAGINLTVLRAMYEIMHDADDLAGTIRPHAIILHDAFSKMIGQIHDTL